MCSAVVKLWPIVLDNGPHSFSVIESTTLSGLKVVTALPRVKTLSVPGLHQYVQNPRRLTVR